MSIYYTLKGWLKRGRWQLRRGLAATRWSSMEQHKLPAVLGNAMPKSGSHLIIQVLQGLIHLGPFVNPGFPPVNRGEDNRKLSVEEILANIVRMRPGDIAYGYIASDEPFLSALTQPERASIFVYRDPRDMIISHVFYATDMHEGHWMHNYYANVLKTMEERINAAIQGVEEPGSELTPVRARYMRYIGWLQRPEVLSLRFEDLILNRDRTLGCLLDYLAERGFTPQASRQEAISVLAQSIAPRKSGTFRKGQPGNWKEHFTETNKALFKELAGDLLVQLEYEKDHHW